MLKQGASWPENVESGGSKIDDFPVRAHRHHARAFERNLGAGRRYVRRLQALEEPAAECSPGCWVSAEGLCAERGGESDCFLVTGDSPIGFLAAAQRFFWAAISGGRVAYRTLVPPTQKAGAPASCLITSPLAQIICRFASEDARPPPPRLPRLFPPGSRALVAPAVHPPPPRPLPDFAIPSRTALTVRARDGRLLRVHAAPRRAGRLSRSSFAIVLKETAPSSISGPLWRGI